MEFSEQTYSFISDDQSSSYSYRECRIVIFALQDALSISDRSEGAMLVKKLQKRLDDDTVSFLKCMEKIWAALRSENGIALHIPISFLDSLTKPGPGSQQDHLEDEEMDLRFCLELDGNGGVFLKRRDGTARLPLQRTVSNVDNEDEWLPYVLTSIIRMFNEEKEKQILITAITWSPGLTEYTCVDTANYKKLQQSSYTLSHSKTSKTHPVVVYTREAWVPVSERAIYELSQTGSKEAIKKLAKLVEDYQLSMRKKNSGKTLVEHIIKIGRKTLPLPGFYWPLVVTFIPCLVGLHSLKTTIQKSLKSNDDTDEYRMPTNDERINIISDYSALTEKLRRIARKHRHALENKKPSTHTEPARVGHPESIKKLVAQPSEKKDGKKEGNIVTTPSIVQAETAQMPARKLLPDKLSQLKAIGITHATFDRPIHHASQNSSAIREKVTEAVKEQVQMEIAARNVYNPPDRTAELATLISRTRQGGSGRVQAIEQLIPNIRSIMNARRGYLHQKLKAGSSQHTALQLWDAFHSDVMPPNIFAELLLNIESDLEPYTFYGIFRDIIYNMYLGMDTRVYLQLLCTSVQSYFSYELYAESTESMKKRTSINALLINTNEAHRASKPTSTWINHHQTLLREIFGLLKEGTQTQIKQVIRFEDEFLNAAGPM